MDNPKTKDDEIYDRLRRIEAGLIDCGIPTFGQKRAEEWCLSPLLLTIHRNRVANLFIQVAHLKDAARRWARLSNIDTDRIEEWCENNKIVSLVNNAASTDKHGLGGRSENNSLLEYQITVMAQAGKTPEPSDKIIDLFWLVVDSAGEPHQSNILIAAALNDWVLFLQNLSVDVKEWVEKWKPRPLPPGMSRYVGKIPEKLMEKIRDDAMRRKFGFG